MLFSCRFSAFDSPFQRDFMQSFLTVSFPHVTGHYDGNFTRHFIEHHMTQLQPMQVISYIMGTAGATFGGTMGSYEVSTVSDSLFSTFSLFH